MINQSHLVLIDLAQSCNKNSNSERDLVEREKIKTFSDFVKLCERQRFVCAVLQPQIPPAGLWASLTVIDGRDEVNLFDLCED